MSEYIFLMLKKNEFYQCYYYYNKAHNNYNRHQQTWFQNL